MSILYHLITFAICEERELFSASVEAMITFLEYIGGRKGLRYEGNYWKFNNFIEFCNNFGCP